MATVGLTNAQQLKCGMKYVNVQSSDTTRIVPDGRVLRNIHCHGEGEKGRHRLSQRLAKALGVKVVDLLDGGVNAMVDAKVSEFVKERVLLRFEQHKSDFSDEMERTQNKLTVQ